MNIDEREAELNSWFKSGEITQKEWAKLWQEALEDTETYPEPDKEAVN